METDLLAESIDEKLRVLVQLHALARRQIELIGEGGDMTALLTVLSAKQNLLAELSKIEEKLDPFRDQDPAGRVWRSEEDRRRCAAAADRCRALIDETLLLEKQGEADLTKRRDRTAAQLQAAGGAARARRAYAHSAAGSRRQIDLTSDA